MPESGMIKRHKLKVIDTRPCGCTICKKTFTGFEWSEESLCLHAEQINGISVKPMLKKKLLMCKLSELTYLYTYRTLKAKWITCMPKYITGVNASKRNMVIDTRQRPRA